MVSSAVDTIVAVATPPGIGAVGVVRLSGRDAVAIADVVAPGVAACPPRRASVRRVMDGAVVVDEVVAIVFRGPASFTGEDVVELQGHGGTVTLDWIVERCVDAGARPAEAGEFTRRAVLNGRLDLVRAEAIADVIHARDRAGHRLAQAHLAGALSRRVDGLKDALAAVLVQLEAAIDFSLEEHVYSVSPSDVADGLAPVFDGLTALLDGADDGRLRHDGVRVALTGPPNAGKSTLLNALLGDDRAIVTPIAGTTRDVVTGEVVVGGIRYVLSDTAGLRETDDPVERIGVERARSAVDAADIVLDVRRAPDGAAPMPAYACPSVRVWTHVDVQDAPTAPEDAVACAVPTGAGVDALRAALTRLAREAGLRDGGEGAVLTRARHRAEVRDAHGCIERAIEAAEAGFEHELIAHDVRLALDALGRLTGAITSDDVLARVFDGFCIGK